MCGDGGLQMVTQELMTVVADRIPVKIALHPEVSVSVTVNVARSDDEAELQKAGVEVLGKTIYDPAAASFDTEVGEVAAADPDAIVLITFDEGARILKTMVELGIGPSAKAVYGCDGNMGNALGEAFDAA